MAIELSQWGHQKKDTAVGRKLIRVVKICMSLPSFPKILETGGRISSHMYLFNVVLILTFVSILGNVGHYWRNLSRSISLRRIWMCWKEQ